MLCATLLWHKKRNRIPAAVREGELTNNREPFRRPHNS